MIKSFFPVKFYISLTFAHAVGRRRASYAIITLGQHTRWEDVRRRMTSSPLDNIQDRSTSGVACNYCLWPIHIVKIRRVWMPSTLLDSIHRIERRRAWHAITPFGQHTRSDNLGSGMLFSPLDTIHCWMMSGMECHHRLWTADTVEWCRHGMLSSPFDLTEGLKMSGVVYHYYPSATHIVRRCRALIPSFPLGSTHGHTTLGVACHLTHGQHTR